MNYSSTEFIVTFPIFLALFWAIRGRTARLIALAVASVAFYAYGEPAGIPILASVIALSYVCGRAIERWPARSVAIATVGIALLLVDLGWFKYIGLLTSLVPAFPQLRSPLLPLGISFFTFEAIAYIADLVRGITRMEPSALRLGLYAGVFPHLISGPIMRPNQLIPQLQHDLLLRSSTFSSGLLLFVEGLAKKRLIADPAGQVADLVFTNAASVGTLDAWLGAIAYTVQIYGDFAGYTDMGRGIARMLGLELPINFDAPYTATSITDFWRRWHISLSSWLRDYLYIPLGGNRKGEARTYVNLLVTMLLGGLWHGAGTTFIAWGGYHGALLALERRFGGSIRPPWWLAAPVTLMVVLHGWVLFRAQSWTVFVQMIQAMYTWHVGEVEIGPRAGLTLAAFGVVILGMSVRRWRPQILERLRHPTPLVGAAYGAIAGLALVAAPAATRPFIYFRF